MGFSSAVAHAAATAAATTAGSSAQQQQRRLQRQRRAALGPRECAGRATVGGPRHNSNVGRIRRERAGKRGKGYIKKKKRATPQAAEAAAGSAVSAGLCLGVLKGDLMVKQLCITRAAPASPSAHTASDETAHGTHAHTNATARAHHQPRKVISKLSGHQSNQSAEVWTMRIVVHHAGAAAAAAAAAAMQSRAHVRSQTDQETLSAAGLS